MNKKRIIVIVSMVVAIACVGGLVGFNIYNNKKVQTQQQEQVQQQEMDSKPAANEKDDNGNYVDPTATTTEIGTTGMTATESSELQVFFGKSLMVMFNVPDTSNIPQTTKDWENENVDPNVVKALNEDTYTKFKTVKLEKYNIQLISKQKVTYNGNSVDGYIITYTCNLNLDGKEDTLNDHSDQSKATAIIVKENNKFKLAEPNNPE